jgi:hypothetical protein
MSSDNMNSEHPSSHTPNLTSPKPGNLIMWGAYLACSWTWCIGMFFPVLLIRDHGWAGFLVFAIPNVLGAAAMGWVLKSKLQSINFVEKHPAAVWWFSVITLAFHIFWIVWISSFIRRIFPLPDEYLAGVGAVVIAFSIASGRAIRFERTAQMAMVLIIVSIGVLIATFVTPMWGQPTSEMARSAPDPFGAYWMLPISVFGFMLCPYLDVTFHHARQQLDTAQRGRIGFTLGFVVFFALMIVLTTQYAAVIVGAMDPNQFVPQATSWLGAMLMVHILCQWIFTVRVHLNRMQTIPGKIPTQGIFYSVAFMAGAAALAAGKIPDYAGLSIGEVIYRCFIGAYGLLLPSYVLFKVLLAKRAGSAFNTKMMWISIVLATPMFWLGFIERQPMWLAPGIAMVLIGSIVILIQSPQSD